jgi:HK97 family phage portal protein
MTKTPRIKTMTRTPLLQKSRDRMQQKAGTPSWYNRLHAYIQHPAQATWSNRKYTNFAEEAYHKNVIANQSVRMIAQGVAAIAVLAHDTDTDGQHCNAAQHPLCHLLHKPNPAQNKTAFLEMCISYYLLSGNVFIHAVQPHHENAPRELYVLRPDRVTVIAGQHALPEAYHYAVNNAQTVFPVHPITGESALLHIKHFNPLNDWYGLAPAASAAYSIDQHNQAAAWNQSLLQNGARPSGALVMNMTESGGRLTEDQFWRLKNQVDEQFSGAHNAGRPLLLEGGLEWKEMSLNPRDMDFLNIKNSSARDIALAFGVPPQLLGIPGDNTYANLAEARIALWEQTIIPLAQHFYSQLEAWLNPRFGSSISLALDMDNIPALAPKREAKWRQINEASFLSDAEKRQLLGLNAQEI